MEVSWGVKSACVITFGVWLGITQQNPVFWCKKACKCKKEKTCPVYLPKCNNTVDEEKCAHSPSFLSLSGTALEIDGEADVEGGEAGFSVSMFASRL
jgi:hypothetical protein